MGRDCMLDDAPLPQSDAHHPNAAGACSRIRHVIEGVASDGACCRVLEPIVSRFENRRVDSIEREGRIEPPDPHPPDQILDADQRIPVALEAIDPIEAHPCRRCDRRHRSIFQADSEQAGERCDDQVLAVRRTGDAVRCPQCARVGETLERPSFRMSDPDDASLRIGHGDAGAAQYGEVVEKRRLLTRSRLEPADDRSIVETDAREHRSSLHLGLVAGHERSRSARDPEDPAAWIDLHPEGGEEELVTNGKMSDDHAGRIGHDHLPQLCRSEIELVRFFVPLHSLGTSLFGPELEGDLGVSDTRLSSGELGGDGLVPFERVQRLEVGVIECVIPADVEQLLEHAQGSIGLGARVEASQDVQRRPIFRIILQNLFQTKYRGVNRSGQSFPGILRRAAGDRREESDDPDESECSRGTSKIDHLSRIRGSLTEGISERLQSASPNPQSTVIDLLTFFGTSGCTP